MANFKEKVVTHCYFNENNMTKYDFSFTLKRENFSPDYLFHLNNSINKKLYFLVWITYEKDIKMSQNKSF